MGKLSDFSLGDAYARNTDPSTSHAAAESMQPKAAHVEGIVADAVIASGTRGLICDEICDVVKLPWNTVSPRLKPLQRKHILTLKLNPETGKPLTRPGRSGKQQQILFKF